MQKIMKRQKWSLVLHIMSFKISLGHDPWPMALGSGGAGGAAAPPEFFQGGGGGGTAPPANLCGMIIFNVYHNILRLQNCHTAVSHK